MSTDLEPAAKCGMRTLPGECWRPGDHLKHLGPPESLGIHYWSALFSTRCGLGPSRSWRSCGSFPFANDDDYWCPACLTQAGMSFELYDDA